MPMDRARYPDNWEKIALAVKTAAGWKCQKCGKQCRKPGEPFDTHKRTLTVAHLNHTPEDVREENLMAMCAPCHLRYDAKHHAETRKRKRGNVMAEQVFIRAEIIGTLPSGQKRIHLLAGVDGMVFTTDESQLIRPDEQFVPRKWIEAYAEWLTTIPAPFAANDERSIRAMLAKWKTNPDLPKPECSEDACDL